MELIRDGNLMLQGVTTGSIGSDTVILFDSSSNTLYINAHLKELKPPDPKKADDFTPQMEAILRIVHGNPGIQIVLMMDANTQFRIEGRQIIAYSKDAKKPIEKFNKPFTSPCDVTSVTSTYPTSYKMRGAHTAQLDKSLDPVSAVIDHILIFNSQAEIRGTDIFVLNPAKDLQKVTDANTATTSPVSIADHALVISSTDSIAYGTLNIKGGNTEDAAWAEFVPKEYFDFFMANKPTIKVGMLKAAFPESLFPEVPDVSKPRCSIFDINLPNELTPVVKVDTTTIYIEGAGTKAHFTKSGDLYEIAGPVNPALSEWMAIFLKDLNELDISVKDELREGLREKKRNFLLEKGYALLNYWHIVQTNDPTAPIYDAWYKASKEKVPISQMIAKAKATNPLLKVLALQELPKGFEDSRKLVAEIQAAVPCTVYYHDDVAISPTRGGIVVFHSVGGKRTKKSRKRNNKKSKKTNKRRYR